MHTIAFRSLTARLLLLIAMLAVGSVQAQNVAITQCQGKCPAYTSDLAATRSNIVVHHVFAAGLNANSGEADWVAYRMTKEAVGVASLLPRIWQPDELMPFSLGGEEVLELESTVISLSEISSTPNPYGGFNALPTEQDDRARLAPMTSFANTPYWTDLNKLSNMVPMPAPLRTGAWLLLEQALNQLVSRYGELYVVSGPLYLINQGLSTSLDNADFGPAAYFKVVVSDDELAAFVFPENLGQHVHYCQQLGKVEQIEQMSGLELFPGRSLHESTNLLADLGCTR